MARKAQPAPPPAPAEPRGPAPEFEGRVTPQRSSMVDPDVQKPPEVAAASARADEIWRQAYGQQESPAEEQVVSPDHALAEPPAGDAEEQQEQFEEQPQERGEDPAQWEHRYNSMRGRYEQVAEQNRELMTRMSWFEKQMQAQRANPPAPPQAPQAQRPQLVSKEEQDEYGADFLDLVGRRAREDITPELAQLKGELKQLRQQVGNVGTHIAMDARGRMEAELDQLLPEWRDINMEQEFLDWLSLPDAYSGANRHQLLRQAFEQNHTPRVQAFFQGFLQEAAASRPAEPRPAPAGQSNQAPPPQPQRSLSQWAAPGRGRSAGAPQPSAGKAFISRDDISRFYNDVRAGKYAGRQAEKSQAEAEIMDAQREGRIA